MKVAIGSVFVVAALVIGPVSVHAAAPQAAAVRPADSTLDERIEKRIEKDPSLKKHDIKIVVKDGVATLTGTVASQAERRKATQLATVPGVARVDNQIVVDPSARTTRGTAGTIGDKTKEGAEKTKEGAVKVGEKTKEGAVKVGEKTKEGLSKTGEAITDTWILTRVKSKFVGEDVLKGSDINVDVNDHVVTLKGTVPSAAAKARAIEQAKEVEGVHRVVDQLTIGPKK
jgi:osmotically-inducible protein OsmY